MAGFTPSRDQLTDRDSELWKSLDNKDLYRVLGVPPDASGKDIERAFRRKARDVHPDKHTDALSTERFKELSNAKELLLDIGRRWWYDQRREQEAAVIARAMEGAKLRAKAKSDEQMPPQEVAVDEEKRRQELVLEKEKLAQFVEQAQAQARAMALRADQEGHSSDEDGPFESQLRASAPDFVPAGGYSAPAASAASAASGAAAAPASDRVVEVYSISARKWCMGLVVELNPLPGGRAALTVRYQVMDGQWNEKMLYDNDPNLRKRQRADGAEKDRSTDLWNQWKDQQGTTGTSELRAEAQAFVSGALPCGTPMQGVASCRPAWHQFSPSAPVHPGAHPHGPRMPLASTRQLQVAVPLGCVGGQHINIVTDAGRQLAVQIPHGLLPGQTFLCTEPPASGPCGFLHLGQRPVQAPMPQNVQQMPARPCIMPQMAPSNDSMCVIG